METTGQGTSLLHRVNWIRMGSPPSQNLAVPSQLLISVTLTHIQAHTYLTIMWQSLALGFRAGILRIQSIATLYLLKGKDCPGHLPPQLYLSHCPAMLLGCGDIFLLPDVYFR